MFQRFSELQENHVSYLETGLISDTATLAYNYLPTTEFANLSAVLPHAAVHNGVWQNKYQYYFPEDYQSLLSKFQKKCAQLPKDASDQPVLTAELATYWQGEFTAAFNKKFDFIDDLRVRMLIHLIVERRVGELQKLICLKDISLKNDKIQNGSLLVTPLLLMLNQGRQKDSAAPSFSATTKAPRFQNVLDDIFKAAIAEDVASAADNCGVGALNIYLKISCRSFFFAPTSFFQPISIKQTILFSQAEASFLWAILCHQDLSTLSALYNDSFREYQQTMYIAACLAVYLGYYDAVNFILSRGGLREPYVVGNMDLRNPLELAVCCNDLEMVKMFFDPSFSIAAAYRDPKAAFRCAHAYSRYDIMRELLNMDSWVADSQELGLAMTVFPQDILSRLHRLSGYSSAWAQGAILANQGEIFNRLMVKWEANIIDEHMEPLLVVSPSNTNILWYAAHEQRAAIVECLLKSPNAKRALVNQSYRCQIFKAMYEGVEAFHIALLSKHKKIVDVFYRYALDDIDFAFALFHDGSLTNETLEKLLEYKDKINAYNRCLYFDGEDKIRMELYYGLVRRYAPLYAATLADNCNAVARLLECGAEVNAPAYGFGPGTGLAQKLQESRALSRSLKLKCDPEVDMSIYRFDPNEDNEVTCGTALHVAVMCENNLIARRLLAHGADVLIMDHLGRKPSDFATDEIKFELLLCEFLQMNGHTSSSGSAFGFFARSDSASGQEIAAALMLHSVLFADADPACLNQYRGILMATGAANTPLQKIYQGLAKRMAEITESRVNSAPTLAAAAASPTI